MSFEEVAERVGKSKVPTSVDLKTKMYGLYKRATVGRLVPPFTDDDDKDAERPKSRPGMFNVQARSKYDGWKWATDEVATREEAKEAYIKMAEAEIFSKE